MKITIVTAWGSEAELAPYFLKHYSYADEIIILYGQIEDKTLEIAASYPNVRLVEVHYQDNRWSMWVKQKAIDDHCAKITEGWFYCVDADEFIFPMVDGNIIDDPHDFLEKADGNIMRAWIWQVFRSEQEKDLVPDFPIIYQRRYGIADFKASWKEGNVTKYAYQYIKPVVAKPEAKPLFHPGGHEVHDRPEYAWSSEQFWGTHWHYADADMAIVRETRKIRNIVDDQRWLVDGVNEDVIRKLCEDHLNDPRLF